MTMPDAEPSFDTLIQRILAGDGAACEELVLCTSREVRSTLAVQVSDLAAVDDLAQEVYLHVLARLDHYRPGSDFLAWLKTVARFQALGWRRQQQRRQAAHQRYRIAVQSRLGELSDALPDDGSHHLSHLRACLDRLSAAARQLIHLHYNERLQVPALAVHLARSANGIHVSLSRVRKALAACLANAETTATAREGG